MMWCLDWPLDDVDSMALMGTFLVSATHHSTPYHTTHHPTPPATGCQVPGLDVVYLPSVSREKNHTYTLDQFENIVQRMYTYSSYNHSNGGGSFSVDGYDIVAEEDRGYSHFYHKPTMQKALEDKRSLGMYMCVCVRAYASMYACMCECVVV